MTNPEADALAEEIEAELRDILPEGVGVCLFIIDEESGITYRSNLPRATVVSIMGDFAKRNTQ